MRIVSLALCLPLTICAQSLADFEKRVTEFTLANGLHFIVLERRSAPVVSFHAYVNAGSVNDPRGATSMAHMFEHMIGKGTTTVGSTDWPAERKALEAVEEVYDRLENERNKGPRADKQKIAALETELEKALQKANSYVVPNAYMRVIEENGSVGFNAGTSQDSTTYYYSLPANRTELWFLLQSEWFRRPVFREFYKERDVVREERRMRVESNPQGKLFEALTATAFTAHPYRTLIGWASDIENLRAKGADDFFRRYYVPGNITIAIAGDVTAAQIKRLADRYFSSLPSGPMPAPVTTEEPPQEGEKRVMVETPAQPFVAMAYKRPSHDHPDDPVFDVLSVILSSGRTGMIYKDLVRDKKIALAAAAFANFPGSKYTNLFIFAAMPNMGHTNEENEKALLAIVERLKKEKVDAATLERVKTKVRAGLIRQLDSNAGMAELMAMFHANFGNWRKLFTSIQDVEKVTADDVQRVARQYFTDSAKTVAVTVKPAAPAKEASK